MALLLPFDEDHPNVNSMFPSDVIDRAKVYLKAMKGGWAPIPIARAIHTLDRKLQTIS